MKRRVVAVFLAISFLFLFLSAAPKAQAANGFLVVAAFRTLEREYIDPVKPVSLLNATITSLRKATGQSEDSLPDIPPGPPEATAVNKFNDEFKQATHASKRPETDLADMEKGEDTQLEAALKVVGSG